MSIKNQIKVLVTTYNGAVKLALSKNSATKRSGVRVLKRTLKRATTLMRAMGIDNNDRRVLSSILRKGNALLKKIDKPVVSVRPATRRTIRPVIRPVFRPGAAQQAFATGMRPVAQAAIEANNAAVISPSAEAAAEQADEAAASIEEPEATEAVDTANATAEATAEESEEPTLFEKLWPTDKPVIKRPGLYVAGAVVLIGAMAMSKGSK